MIKPQAPPEVVRPHITEVITISRYFSILFMIMIDWNEPPAIQSPSEAGDPV